MASYYEILGVSPSASPEALKRAYRKKAKETHPDINPEAAASGKFVMVNEAYEILSDPSKRSFYDQRLKYGLDRMNGRQARAAANHTKRARGPRTAKEQRNRAYDDWVRRAQGRAKKHANMRYEDFTKTKFYQAEATAFRYLQFLVYGFGLLLAFFIMFFPVWFMLKVDWKFLLLLGLSAPFGVKLLLESFNGFRSLSQES